MIKPASKRYAFHYLNQTQYQYQNYARGYALAKRTGYRGICLWASGVGAIEILREVATNSLKRYGKKKLAIVCLSARVWAVAPFMTLITNSSRIINATTRIHSLISFGAECLEDSGNLVFLPVDLALFGQPIPIGEENCFNIMKNITYFTDFLKD